MTTAIIISIIVGFVCGLITGAIVIFKPTYLKGYDQGIDDMAAETEKTIAKVFPESEKKP